MTLQLVDFIFLLLWIILISIWSIAVAKPVLSVLSILILAHIDRWPWRRYLLAAEVPGLVDGGRVAADAEPLRASKLAIAICYLLTGHTVRRLPWVMVTTAYYLMVLDVASKIILLVSQMKLAVLLLAVLGASSWLILMLQLIGSMRSYILVFVWMIVGTVEAA